PDRLPRRHLRLLRAVRRIEFQECADEAAALARESELLLSLRPRFNRAGTWRGEPRFLAWRLASDGLGLAVRPIFDSDWHCSGPLGVGAFAWRVVLIRLLWSALQPQLGLSRMPGGWFHGQLDEVVILPTARLLPTVPEEVAAHLRALFSGQVNQFADWVRHRSTAQNHPFDLAVRDADLESLSEFAPRVLAPSSLSV